MHLRTMLLFFLAALLLPWGISAGDADQKPVGIKKRIPWTTSKVKGTPEPPLPYRTEVAFPKIRFTEPLDLSQVPGTDRMIVAQRKGKVFSFKNNLQAQKEELLDLKTTIYGVVCHPNFAKNGYLYVTVIPNPDKDTPNGTKVKRFTVDLTTWKADPKTEKVIIEWPS